MASTFQADISAITSRIAGDMPDFSLEYVSLAGRRLGGIREWETRLEVRSDGASELFRRRGPGDSPRRPPGRFQGRITGANVSEFLEVLAESGIEKYLSDAPGPMEPITFLRLHLGSRLYAFSWSPSIAPMPEPMARLKRMLADWVNNACPNPLWSLSLKADRLEFKGHILRAQLRVENQGTQEIHIAHPLSPGFGPVFGLHLKYGEAQWIQEGITPDPVEEKDAPIGAEAFPAPELVRIPPNESFDLDFSSRLEGEALRGWIGAFAFLHYLSEDRLAGIPVFNGALFSEDLKW